MEWADSTAIPQGFGVLSTAVEAGPPRHQGVLEVDDANMLYCGKVSARRSVSGVNSPSC